MSIESVVTDVVNRVNLTGAPPSDVVRTSWAELSTPLMPGEMQALAQVGLIKLSNDAMSETRHPRHRFGAQASVQVTVQNSEADPAESVLVSVRYETEGGAVKPLLHFSIADCMFVEERARQNAAGWLQVAEFMADIREKLMLHGVETVQELPAAVRSELEEKWPT